MSGWGLAGDGPLTCADCGKRMHRTVNSFPQGLARCHACRGVQQRCRKACEHCRRVYESSRVAQRFCSSACSYAARQIRSRSCVACGAPFVNKGGRKAEAQRACGRCCGSFIRNGRWPQSPVRQCDCGRFVRVGRSCDDISHVVESRRYPACRVFVTSCCVCDRWFCSPYTVSTCSVECANAKRLQDKRQQKDKRRALKRDAYVADVVRADVYARDKYRCQLCHKKLRMNVVVPHPLAPVLDHIIPLACGGTHEPANVQAAHFQCNSIKAHRGGGEQLLLIG